MSLLEEADGGRGKGEEGARPSPSFLMAQFSVLGPGACGCPASQGALLLYSTSAPREGGYLAFSTGVSEAIEVTLGVMPGLSPSCDQETG